MGMQLQESVNVSHGEGESLGVGFKNKYRKMDSQVFEDDDDFAVAATNHHRQLERIRTTKKYVYACAVFASLNSVLLGYDVGVMSGAILFIQQDLNITEVQEEILVGCLSIVSIFGSLAGGRTSDAIGRKWTMGLAAIIFQAGALTMTLAPSFEILMIGRLLAGVGIGFGVMIAPVYIVEISPTAARESPRWLVMQNRVDEAKTVLSKTNETDKEVEERLQEILAAAGVGNSEKGEQKAVWRELLKPSPPLRRMLVTGFGIQCFQQITGIDATVYYSPEIFKDAGIEGNTKLLAATVAVGVTKTVFILVAILLIDRVGRKPLLYVSTIGMTVCLFSLAASVTFLGKGALGIALAVLSVCGNVAFFSIGIGPVCWVITSEIFPLRLRAQASALGAIGNRVCSGIVAMSFLSVSRSITVAGTFFIFSVISALSVAFVHWRVPETKGKSLEQIELLFKKEHDLQTGQVEMSDVQRLVQKL